MNILYIETSLDPYRGGVQRVTWLISNYLRRADIDIYFAYHIADYDEIPSDHKIKYSTEWTTEQFYDTLSSFIKENKIDVIISQDRKSPFYTKVYKKIKQDNLCKIIHCVHQSPDFFKHISYTLIQKTKRLIYSILHSKSYIAQQEQKIYTIADRTVLLSSSFIDDYVKLNKLKDAKKVVSISNPLSFNNDASDEDIKKKDNKVLIIARLEEQQKNIKSALRIWKKICNKVPEGWTLVLGGYGPDEKTILEYAKELNLLNFEFIGKVLSPQDIYKKASIFMLTSHYEGFGMTLTEAQQNGCITLAYNTYSAVKDIIVDDYNGYIISPYDEDGYASKIMELILNEEKRKQMQCNAIESTSKFKLEEIGNKWLELINEVVNEK